MNAHEYAWLNIYFEVRKFVIIMNTFCYGKSYLSEDDYVPELGLVNALNCANNFGFNLNKNIAT